MAEDDLSLEEFFDGFALWEEHKPQTGEDWVKVAERFIADGCTTENSSPLFAAIVAAVRERDSLRSAAEGLVEAIDFAEANCGCYHEEEYPASGKCPWHEALRAARSKASEALSESDG